MRLAAAFLLLAVPITAAAQPTTDSPPAPSVPARPEKPVEHKRPAHKRVEHKRPEHKPAKPAKPATPAKPSPPAAPPAHHPKPAPAPAAVAPPATPAPDASAEPTKGSNTGLPLPRFAALRSDDVNFRSGPGTRYPIEWVYKRRDLPVEIEREFEVWRLVRDEQGTKGWVHQATLTGRRTAIVSGTEQTLRQAGSDTAAAVAKLQPGVILRIRSCDAGSDWCQAQVGDYHGWIKRSEIWGVLPDEVIQ